MVAAARAAETARTDGLKLISDPFAELLGGVVGRDAFKNYHAIGGNNGIPSTDGGDSEVMKELNSRIDGCAVRTRKIDDEMKKFLTEHGNRAQICALGAGLDTRPWRIELTDASGAVVDTTSVKYFEVDFPEMFEYKLSVLASASAVPKFTYISAVADLSLPGWPAKLVGQGFDAAVPTLWVLEGFTGYLTELEFHILFAALTTQLCAPHSRLIATFLTPATSVAISMHRFIPEDPLSEVTKHIGWTGVQDDIRNIGFLYDRPITDNSMNGYYIVVADYQ